MVVLLYWIAHFFFNDTATTEIYTLSLHDALPISVGHRTSGALRTFSLGAFLVQRESPRSEEHTSELQSRLHLVCRLLLEKKNNRTSPNVREPKTIKHTSARALSFAFLSP